MFVSKKDGTKVPWVHYCYLVRMVAMGGNLKILSVLLKEYDCREFPYEKKEKLVRSLPIKEVASLISLQLLQFF